MTESEKPLHVRVAEALGWTECAPWVSEHRLSDRWSGVWPGSTQRTLYAPHGLVRTIVPKFDVDWSETGPLLGRFKIRVSYAVPDGHAYAGHQSVGDYDQQPGERDILPAICRVILALHERGRLDR